MNLPLRTEQAQPARAPDVPAPVPASPRYDPATDAVKGLLILLIAAGHDAPLQAVVPGSSPFLYGFHVIGFLLLPFLLPAPPPSWRMLADRSVRYLAPYLAFVLLAAGLYTALFTRHDPLGHVVARTLSGLVLGSADAIKLASGFALFWFLPSLWSLTLLRSGLQNLERNRALHLAAIASLVALHGTLAAFPHVHTWLPLGLAPALIALPLGLAAAWLWPRVRRRPVALLVVAAVVAVVARLVHLDTNLGAMVYEDWRHPLRLLLQDAHALTAFLAIVAAGPWLTRVPGLVRLGRWSMGVYLGHSFFLQAFLLAGTRLGFAPTGRDAAWFALPTLVIAVAGGVLVARCLEVEPLRRWLVPRGWQDWPPTSRLGHRTA